MVRKPKTYINEKNGKEKILNDINLGLVNQKRNTGFVPPEGVFNTKGERTTINSSNHSFFPNAKAASMLERGWVRTPFMKKGDRGLIVLKDGPEMEVEVIEGFNTVGTTSVDPDTIFPMSIKHAALLLVGQYYDNRQAVTVGVSNNPLSFGLHYLLDPYKIPVMI